MRELRDYDAFILDLDGTLIDSGSYHARAFADAVQAESGYALKPAEFDEFFGMHSTWFSGVLNERYGLSLDPLRVLQRKRARVKEIFVAELFDGVRSFLEFWFGRIPLALASNSPAHFVLPALEECEIRSFFETIVTADDVERRKPHPEMIEKTSALLQVAPSRSLVFEDQQIGVAAARSAGAGVVAVNNGQPGLAAVGAPVCSWNDLLTMSKEII